MSSVTRAILLILLAEAIVALLAVYGYGYTLEGLQATTRYSGRFSLLVFSIIFMLMPGQEQVLRQTLSPNPYLIFAVAHGIHLLELLSYIYLSGTPLIPLRLAGGFVAYLFIFVMPLLHNRFLQSRLTIATYTVVINVYLYYVWFIFFMSYLPRVQGKLPHAGGKYWEFVVLLCWVCVMLGSKLSQLLLAPRTKRR